MSEILDIYDAKMNHIGVANREDVHKLGYWHQTFHCWIVRNENGKNYVLFQIRDKEKSVAPNKLDITAAGHLKAGETKEDGLRELEEELGIRVNIEQLHYLGIRITASENSKQINKEFAQVYMLHDDTPMDRYTLQEGEVAGLVQIEVSDGLRLCAHEVDNIPCTVFRPDKNGVDVEQSTVEFGQFISRIDSYYYKIFIMAERYFKGSRYLSI
ncbi:NUDIX hydrolase [Bariatricus sp. SGI.161]|uniref:NUDIX hydrolase n=1 Tax=Bariatricus sp. SGI.161 TaxID=3420550 RepID=UPI003D0486E9